MLYYNQTWPSSVPCRTEDGKCGGVQTTFFKGGGDVSPRKYIVATRMTDPVTLCCAVDSGAGYSVPTQVGLSSDSDVDDGDAHSNTSTTTTDNTDSNGGEKAGAVVFLVM